MSNNLNPVPNQLEVRLARIEEMLGILVTTSQQNLPLGQQEVPNPTSRLATPRSFAPLPPSNHQDEEQFVYHGPPVVEHQTIGNSISQRIDYVEKLVRGLKGVESQIIDIEGLCFFPNARLPIKFKWTAEKFDGTGDPKPHLRSFIGILRQGQGFSDEQLGLAFQFSLTGEALRWLMHLNPSQIHSWSDITKAFINQYSYNTEVDTRRRELEMMVQLPNEGFTSFLTRFRSVAAQMWNRPSEREQVSMMMNGLNKVYKSVIFGQEIFSFNVLIAAGQHVEDVINHGYELKTLKARQEPEYDFEICFPDDPENLIAETANEEPLIIYLSDEEQSIAKITEKVEEFEIYIPGEEESVAETRTGKYRRNSFGSGRVNRYW